MTVSLGCYTIEMNEKSFSIKQKFFVDIENETINPVDLQTKEFRCINWKITHRIENSSTSPDSKMICFDLDCSPNSITRLGYYSNSKWEVSIQCKISIMKTDGNFYVNETNDTFYELVDPTVDKCPRQFSKPTGMQFSFENLKAYVINNHLEVKYNVIILTSSCVGWKLRNFVSRIEGFSDVALDYEGRLYYVNKKYLSTHSKYFEKLFNDKQGEKIVLKKKEDNVLDNPVYFQRFLELMYGEPALDDSVVVQIVRLGKTYDAPAVMRQCEYFLMNTSKKPLSEKFDLSRRFELDNLQLHCLSEMKTVEDIQSVLPTSGDLKYETMAMLIEKLEQLK
ncbi:hypothetical protein CAEBREN_25183 [Caenorhabditis brenneri]|uniref:BTB domain-containing protein n=1 Tax=Caenorhabditis brenneri TaxID=135651 RepID=G0P036_CAEBE|nr:hypothetical protein CAEBREN_25183 [Caenorhabditis brenneri]